MKRPITENELTNLRKEIVLCSVFVNDYRNSFGIDKNACCDFFDGYSEFLEMLMLEDGIDDNEYFDHVGLYDNDSNLIDWFYSFENCPLLVETEEEE